MHMARLLPALSLFYPHLLDQQAPKMTKKRRNNGR